MPEFNKIMVAIAFSPYSEGILQYAANLSKRLGSELIICSIINQRDVNAIKRIVQLGYEVDSDHYVRGVKAERKTILDELIEKQGIDQKQIKILFKIGNPVYELMKTAIAEDVDMIVMGIKANTGFEQMVVGSVAEKAFRRSPVTIVSYRDPSIARRLQKRIQV